MLRIFNIILKDLKLLLRSKSSTIIALLGPLLIVFLVSLGFNTASVSDLRLGVYSDSYSELSNSLTEKLSNNFFVTKTTSKDECIKGIKSGQYHVCTIFPSNLNVDSKEQIIFYVDYSRINLVYNIIEAVSKELKEKSTELSLELTKVLVTKLNEARVELSGKKSTVNSLTSNMATTQSKLNSVSGSLSSLDLSYTSTNLTDLRNKISDSESSNNISLSSVRSAVSSAEIIINDIGAKLTSASSTRDSLIKDISIINSLISQNSNDISAVSTSLNKITDSIEGIKYTEADTIVNPLKTKIEPLTSGKSNLTYLFPTLLVLLVMFISVLVSSTMIVKEKSAAAYFRNFITPTSEFVFFISHYLTNLLIVTIEMILVLIITLFFMGAEFIIPALNIIAALILIASAFIFIGMIIGYLFKNSETANLASISISSMFLFFSNAIIPIESLPGSIKEIVRYNPFVVSESVVRKMLLFESNLLTEWWPILIIIIYILVLMGAAYLAKQLTKRKLSA